jgi:hypothetical protein
MPSYMTRADGTIVFLVHMTLKPGRDDDLIQVVKTAPPRLLARKLRQLMNLGIAATNKTTRRTK